MSSLYLFVPILAVYARPLGASLSMAGFIISSYGLLQLVLRIPLGAVSDRWGRRKPFVTLAFIIIAVSLLGLAWSPNPTWLLVFRTLTGLFHAVGLLCIAVTVLTVRLIHRAA